MAVRARYSEGAGPFRNIPARVAVPRTTDQLVQLVRHAAAHSLTVTPRGAGSGMPGGNIGGDLLLDLSALAPRIDVWSPDRVTASASTTWKELDRALWRHGTRLPVEPSSGDFCTLGGMIATNAAGPRSYSRGSIRSWVEALTMITAEGRVIRLGRKTPPPADDPTVRRFLDHVDPLIRDNRRLIHERFPETRKNSAGFALNEYLGSDDLLDLVIGSEGTLGIVTEADFRLEPRPAQVGALLISVGMLEHLTPIILDLEPFEPSAIEMMDRTLLKYSGDPRHCALEALLLVEFEAMNRSDLQERIEAARSKTADRAVDIEMAWSADDSARLWQVRKRASVTLADLSWEKRSLQIVEDGCVPLPRLSDYVVGIRRIARELELEVVAFGHAGDGHLHVNVLADPRDPDLEWRLESLWDRGTALVLELGGTPSGEHGDGVLRTPKLIDLYGGSVIELFEQVKSAFDPAGLLNLGVKVGRSSGGLGSSLKVGPNRPALASSAEAELRDRERRGDWTPKRPPAKVAYHTEPR